MTLKEEALLLELWFVERERTHEIRTLKQRSTNACVGKGKMAVYQCPSSKTSLFNTQQFVKMVTRLLS